LSHAERRALIERAAPPLPIMTQAQLLGVSRARLYYQRAPPSLAEVAITHRIDELYTAHPCYGSRKLTALLQPEFAPINRKRVQRYMHALGSAAVGPQPKTRTPAVAHPVYPYLLRGVAAQGPNPIWGSEITYSRLQHGWLYLVVVLDWYARDVVRWALDDTRELPLVLDAVDQAVQVATPLSWNTDQGSQFTSP